MRRRQSSLTGQSGPQAVKKVDVRQLISTNEVFSSIHKGCVCLRLSAQLSNRCFQRYRKAKLLMPKPTDTSNLPGLDPDNPPTHLNEHWQELFAEIVRLQYLDHIGASRQKKKLPTAGGAGQKSFALTSSDSNNVEPQRAGSYVEKHGKNPWHSDKKGKPLRKQGSSEVTALELFNSRSKSFPLKETQISDPSSSASEEVRNATPARRQSLARALSSSSSSAWDLSPAVAPPKSRNVRISLPNLQLSKAGPGSWLGGLATSGETYQGPG